jgi:hypothetical protein
MQETLIKIDKKIQEDFLSEKDSESDKGNNSSIVNKGKPKLILIKEDEMFSKKLNLFNNKMKEINHLYYSSQSNNKLQQSLDFLKKENIDSKAKTNYKTIEHSRHPSYISGTTKSKFDSLTIDHDNKTERYQSIASSRKNKTSLIKNSSSFVNIKKNSSQQGSVEKRHIKKNSLNKSPRNSILSGSYMSNLIESKRISKNDVLPSMRRKARVYENMDSNLLSFKTVPKNVKLSQAINKDDEVGFEQLTDKMFKGIGKKLGFFNKPKVTPKLKTNNFNKFLINDFLIGEKTNAIENSK